MAEKIGLLGGETVLKAGFEGEALKDVHSFEDLRWRITRGALDGRNLQLLLAAPTEGGTATNRTVLLPLSQIVASQADATLFRTIGILGPWTRPVLGEIMPGSAAEKAGLKAGDLVKRVGATSIVDGQQLRESIRNSAKLSAAAPTPQVWGVLRGTTNVTLEVTPEIKQDAGASVARIGAYVGAPPEFVTVRYGALDGLWRGAVRTWEVSALTVKMMGKMVIGEASLKNLSGPLTIADYAGKSASIGWSAYLTFLALISISLGVLNLLPLPVLDGGHLMYYLWEGITGRSVSDAWMERMQRGGVAILLAMMSISLFNDVTRLLG
jgi:regulator of sigma E protease